MDEEQGPGLADHMLLAANILIAAQGHLTDPAQMGAGDKAGAAHLARHRMGIVHDLDVKGRAWVDGGVLMGVLRDILAAAGLVIGGREGDVQEMMVKDRVLADQTADRARHHRQLNQLGQRRAVLIGLIERGPRRDLGHTGLGQHLAIGAHQAPARHGRRDLAHLLQELRIERLRHHPIKAQEPARDELGHLLGIEQGQMGHGCTSTNCSKKNSYFR